MGLTPGMRMSDVQVENSFIGSCTNSRIEDLRAAAEVAKSRKVAGNVRQALVVPGSGLVKRPAGEEGPGRIFIETGVEWGEPGCPACLAVNPDTGPPTARAPPPYNRTFVGRPGNGARPHSVSPPQAA